MASSLASNSALARNLLLGLPTEIIMLIIEHLDPQEIYSLLFVEPKFGFVQSSTGWRMLPRRQRVSEICISHNVKFGEMSILTCAINNHDTNTVRRLLKEATVIAKTSPLGPNVMQYASRFMWHKWLLGAVRKNQMHVLQAMLHTAGMESYLNEDRFIDDLLFEVAAEQGDTNMMKFLIEHGANPHTADLQGFTPLLLAASSDNMDAVTMLVTQYNVECTVRDLFRSSALHYAIQNSNSNMARLLLENGAQTNVEDTAGYSPLSIAAEEGNVEILRLLLLHGADPNFIELGLLGPLGLSARNGHEEVARILLDETQANVNIRGLLGYTPFMEAVSNRHLDMIKIFIKSPLLNPNERNSMNETALHVALVNDPSLQTAELLLSVDGLRVDEQDDREMTPLMIVLSYMFTSTNKARLMSFIKKLLATGQVDLNTSNSQGVSILQCAIRTKYTEVVQLLLNTGKIDVTPEDVHLASCLGYWEIYDMVMEAAGTRYLA
ncbi:ankyrin repeat [Trichoderma arundinaceum]|uniref:Ankyrin repeat n=1 Tax=Trichoderma arundinaceum TaxID=490622 RepID=A0A395NIC4_TRIAR|nr:ankyrin repeat [Trichoderma arundinaceum]